MKRRPSADPCLGITGLDGGVGVPGDADAAHGEEAGGGLGGAEAEPPFAGAAAERLVDLAGLEGEDVQALGGGIDEEEPLGIVFRVPGPALGRDGGLDGRPLRGDVRTSGAGLKERENEEGQGDQEAEGHGGNGCEV